MWCCNLYGVWFDSAGRVSCYAGIGFSGGFVYILCVYNGT